MHPPSTLFDRQHATPSVPRAVTTAVPDDAPQRPRKQTPAPDQRAPEPDRPDGSLLTEREAARLLAISPRKLWEMRNRSEIAHVRIGRAVR